MAKDPYRYFRIEAQELLEGLGSGLLALDKAPDTELVIRLLRQAHTFKGASRVVKRTDIGDIAHQIEDLLSPHRDAAGPVPRETIDSALALLDRARACVATLENPTTEAAAPTKNKDLSPREQPERPEEPKEDEQTIRVAVHDLDTVLEGAFEAHTAISALRQEGERLRQVCLQARSVLADFPRSQVLPTRRRQDDALELADALDRVQRRIREGIERVQGELSELRAAASELRLVPAQTLMTDLERVTRDAARTLSKEVTFSGSGAETDIDAHVLSGLRKALVHLVRNSVAHGIEDSATRENSGKPASGSVDISIERRGHRVSIGCRDDGRGLDLESVRNAAIERGFVSPEAARAMTEEDLGQVLLRGGVSTSRTVTAISGRGVGLEAVRHAVESLKGEISIRSVSGQGTTVEILVPLSLSAVPALTMHVDAAAVLIPLDSVRSTFRVSAKEISRDAKGEHVVVSGKVLPFVALRRALGGSARGHGANQDNGEMQSAVVIEAEGRLAAVGVDRLGAARSIVVRNIPAHTDPIPIVSGAAFDDEGVPQLVLAPPALIRAADAVQVYEEPTVREVPPLLIIDDSLTTRMLEQSILESAGYEVELAVSAEDGLAKARLRRYGAFIVDVEMPGMNGFEFIEKVRGDPELGGTPSILVTSCADPADKRRGKEVGARAYIVKSEFDQAELLESIRRLVG